MPAAIPDEVLTHLDEALAADDAAEKDFHIRQAEQLVVQLADDD